MRVRKASLIFALLLAAACQDGGGPAPLRPLAPEDAPRGDGALFHPADAGADAEPPGPPAPGEPGDVLYQRLCASCHGALGEGGAGPSLADRVQTYDLSTLTGRIARTMPPADPASCRGACAERVAAFLLDAFDADATDCSAPPLPIRRVRLLTRSEYARTVEDLLFRCTGADCAPPPCGEHTFAFDPGRPARTVHVAGTFNDWPGTLADGGWPLARDPDGIWRATRVLGEGRHAYKFVIDEADWVSDPNNPEGEPDGFGGRNSVLDIGCAEAGGPPPAPADITAGFPPEARPEGFPFDDHAASAQVTAVHAEEHLAAAERLAEAALVRPAALLPCRPEGDGRACAEAFVAGFGRRAFRRPLTPEEQARYRDLVLAGDDFEDGLALALRAFLASPAFLYRTELGVRQPDGTWRLTGHEAASALSYFLWGTMPDDALLDAADAGALDTVAGVEAQARRLLADARARPRLEDFAVQWLGVESLATLPRSAELAPHFGAEVRRAALAETRRFVSHVVFDGSHRFAELLTAGYTFAAGPTAALYGLGDLPGRDLRRVDYPDDRRAGLLGHASVLASYAHSDQTSPIRRGLFVRRRLLCQTLPPPPPDAGGVPEVDPGATTRERFRQHTANPFCHSCHQYIDDVGFGFERFDAIGRWRETENGHAIDALGNMNDVEALGDGTDAPYASLPELGHLLAESERARACFVTQVHRFAHGRLESPADRCALAALTERFAATDDVRELLVAVVTAPEYLLRVEEVE